MDRRKNDVDESVVSAMLKENGIRLRLLQADYDPIAGKDAPGKRKKLVIHDFAIPEQWVPEDMLENPVIKKVAKCGSMSAFLVSNGVPADKDHMHELEKEIRHLRHKYDFPFWAYFCIHIIHKTGGRIRFKLNYAQIKVFDICEEQRRRGLPIDIIICKARQWGGSTFSIFYQTWLAFEWDPYHSFVIAAQVQSASEVIFNMLRDAIEDYPAWDLGLPENVHLHLAPNGQTKNAFVIKNDAGERVWDTIIYIGSAEKPESLRASAVRGAHYSEVGVWPDTPGKSAEGLVAGISGGIPKIPLSMQVMESTAKTMDDFFHTIYTSAKRGESNYRPVFVSWRDIIFDTLPVDDEAEFCRDLIRGRNDIDPMHGFKVEGKYLWRQWQLGATLQGLRWYMYKDKDFTNRTQMMNEAPSDDVEAFTAAGGHVFDLRDVERMSQGCRPWRWEGDLVSDGRKGEDVLQNIRFMDKRGGCLKIWEKPDYAPIEYRYLVCVDIGGTSQKSDWSSVRVFDRMLMMPEYDGVPGVVAEMHYHTEHDLLAYDAMRLAQWYNGALLVIESNTLETKDRKTGINGSEYILDIVSEIYPNLYARESASENIVPGIPRKWGFHTNVNTKPKIIDNMRSCLRERLWDEPSKMCCEEMSEYIQDDNGTLTAPSRKHDDVLMATAIGLWICYREMPLPEWLRRTPLRHGEEKSNAAKI